MLVVIVWSEEVPYSVDYRHRALRYKLKKASIHIIVVTFHYFRKNWAQKVGKSHHFVHSNSTILHEQPCWQHQQHTLSSRPGCNKQPCWQHTLSNRPGWGQFLRLASSAPGNYCTCEWKLVKGSGPFPEFDLWALATPPLASQFQLGALASRLRNWPQLAYRTYFICTHAHIWTHKTCIHNSKKKKTGLKFTVRTLFTSQVNRNSW